MKIAVLCLDDNLQSLFEPFNDALGQFIHSGQIPVLQGGKSAVFSVNSFGEGPIDIEIVSNKSNHPKKVIEEINNCYRDQKFDVVFIDDDWKTGGPFAGQDVLMDAVLSNLKNPSEELPIIVYYTQHWQDRERVEKFRHFLQNNKYEYNKISAFSKDDIASLLLLFQRIISEKKLQMERDVAREETKVLKQQMEVFGKLENSIPNFVGISDSMKMVYSLIRRISTADTTVLITGESGTGKDLAANAIHYISPRSNEPLIKVNCTALPDTLLESELFGHEKGAFTGATARRQGRFELANNGTIFLDEIGDFSLNLQVKLLRIIQFKEFERLGGNETIKANVRIILATNKDLEDLIKQGQFREDLYYRINIFPIHMPPLREKRKDIMLLVGYFLKKIANKNNKDISDISTSAAEILTNYHWPGNVRELENCIERAILLCDDNIIQDYHLPENIRVPSSKSNSQSHQHIDGAVNDMFSAELRSKARQYLDIYEDACKDIPDNRISQRAIAKIIEVKHPAISQKCKEYGKVMIAFLDAFPLCWPNLRKKTDIRKWCQNND